MPKRVLVLGGNRATGLEVVRALKAQGHSPSVLVRPTADLAALNAIQVPTISGQAMRAEDVIAAAKIGFDAIVSAVGGSLLGGDVHYVPTVNMVAAAKSGNIRRVLLISSIGVGDSHDALPRYVHWVLGRAMKQKAKAEECLRSSGLDFTIIRPGNLTNGPATDQARLLDDNKAAGRISRTDVGRLTAQALFDETAVGKTLAAISKSF